MGFPCPATRGVPPTIGSSEGHGAGGLTQKDGEKCPTRFVDSRVLSSDTSDRFQTWNEVTGVKLVA
jgi:hypothetical protein